jgi:hypothetical protein
MCKVKRNYLAKMVTNLREFGTGSVENREE